MRILLINPNTSQFVTDKVVAEARRMAWAGTEIISATGRNGPAIVSGRAEDALAAVEAICLASERSGHYDAVVLAISFDSGLRPLREMLTVPVVGMTEAAMLTACTLGGRFSLVTFGDRAAPIYSDICHSYGLGSRLANVLSLPQFSDAELADPALVLPRLCEAINRTVREDGAETVILVGAVFAGVTEAVADRVGVPVLNGVAEAVGLAEMLVRIGTRKAKSGSYQLPKAKKIVWPDNKLVEMFSKFNVS